MYREIKTNNYDNPNYAIYHIWYIHNSVEEGYKWLGKVEKDDESTANSLHILFDQIDSVWHGIESKYSDIVPTESSVDFRVHLKGLEYAKQLEIQKFVSSTLKKEFRENIEIKNMGGIQELSEGIIKYLKQQIPGRNGWREGWLKKL